MRHIVQITSSAVFFAGLVAAVVLSAKPTFVIVWGAGLWISSLLYMNRSEKTEERVAIDDLNEECANLTAELDRVRAKADHAVFDLHEARHIIKAQEDRISTLERAAMDEASRDKEIQATPVMPSIIDEFTQVAPAIQGGLSAILERAHDHQLARQRTRKAIGERATELIKVAGEIRHQIDSSDQKSLYGCLQSVAKITDDLVQDLHRNTELNLKYAKSIELILESTSAINDITEDIQYISDQTNLLAMNASIEAARAGEHGHGFSIVAEEVRKLSDRTNQASADITRIVSRVSDTIGNVSRSLTDSMQSSRARREDHEANIAKMTDQSSTARRLVQQRLDMATSTAESILTHSKEDAADHEWDRSIQRELLVLIEEVKRIVESMDPDNGEPESSKLAELKPASGDVIFT